MLAITFTNKAANEIKKRLASSVGDPDARTAEYYKIRPCARFVADAAEILDEYLRENPVSTND